MAQRYNSIKDLPDPCTVPQLSSVNPVLFSQRRVIQMCQSGEITAVKLGGKWAIPTRPLIEKLEGK